jgi:FG-GAP repeat protein
VFARPLVIAASLLVFLLTASPAAASYAQQGTKLVGTGAVGAALQGFSVSLSADGNTAVVGGYDDNASVGAAWVYTRSGGVWSQQGSKLVGTGAVGGARQGMAVALSAQGSTAIVGGYSDNAGAGAAWVYTLTGGVWSQQGAKLVGTGATGAAQQGFSVAISADGNTVVVGANHDNANAGAAWIYTRSGGVWSQQGAKLVGTGAVGAARQGVAVSISADGSTAVVGGHTDNAAAGAVWVYTRSAGVWSQQGTKLVGTGAVGAALQGFSVSLSADGNTAAVGGYTDNADAGAVWVYTRSGGVWSQQGPKLIGTGAVGTTPFQGSSVSLSPDGNTFIEGGYFDNADKGAAWVFTHSGGVWSQQGAKLVGAGAVGIAYQGVSVALSSDGNTALVGGFGDDSDVGAAWVFVNPAATSVSDGGSRGFALEVLRPNPTTASGLNVVFALPSGATARLELLDISGRRVLSREVGWLGAGQHTVNLAEGRKVAPGLYWVRLAQGANWRSKRVAVTE